MKKLILFLIVTFSFAIRDYIIKPKIELKKVLYSTTTNYPEPLTSKIASDEYNIFKYQGKFRVIFGKNYQNNSEINNLADSILEIANYVWQKEIIDFGFKKPINSDKYYIDIYIANTNAYNKNENSYITISDAYAGYASAYSNQTPYFVINPEIPLDIVKVTIAHEFFHTIQYAYNLGLVNNEIWDKNLWFMEATAVMIEDEVYDNIDDYKNYLNYYIPYINYALDYHNGNIEYGKVLFAKYLKETYGIEFIKSIFENYKTNKTLLDTIKRVATFYNTTFDDIILEYGVCLANIDTCFEEGESYPKPYKYILGTSINVGEYGITLFNSGSNNYLYSIMPSYLQATFDKEKNILGSINDNGLVFVSKKNINASFLRHNKYNGFILKKGWNLISNPFNENIDFNDFDVKVLWAYRDNRYCAYSNNDTIKNLIKKYNYECDINSLYPNEGVWVYSYNDINLTIKKHTLLPFNKFENGINIRGTSGSLDIKDINDNLTIFYYQDNNWSYYSTNQTYNLNKIDNIYPTKGYFVIKE